MRLLPFASTLILALITVASPMRAEPIQPRVSLELFTSQSCYSCPPAEQLLSELADNDSVLALEWHVDYWDSLVYGSKGRWKDIYSKPEWTQRQRDYNGALRGTAGVYTPQLIVQGQTEVVGSRAPLVMDALARAEASHRPKASAEKRGESILVTLDRPASAMVLVLEERRVIDVTHGENAGKTLSHTNAVLSGQAYQLGAGTFELERPQLAENQACALLVQNQQVGETLLAGYC